MSSNASGSTSQMSNRYINVYLQLSPFKHSGKLLIRKKAKFED